MCIVVLGSINIDLVVQTKRLPKPGETITGSNFFTSHGGKGANQAVACARLMVETRLIGRVGGDAYGAELRENLIKNGVNIEMVSIDNTVPSGTALITVEDSGENTIVIIPGANGRVREEELVNLEKILPEVHFLLLQLEIPLESVRRAIEAANRQGVTVILDPAPARDLPQDLYPLIDILTPNESESATLVGFPITDDKSTQRAAKILHERGAQKVIIKLGDKGAYALDHQREIFMLPFPVQRVDSVAAGDAFSGALAAALYEGKSFEEAIRWGAAGGALAVTKAGAQSSLPDRKSLMKLLGTVK